MKAVFGYVALTIAAASVGFSGGILQQMATGQLVKAPVEDCWDGVTIVPKSYDRLSIEVEARP